MGNIAKFGNDVTRIADALETIAKNQSVNAEDMSWGRIASLVHEGKGSAYFPVGSQLEVTKGSSKIIFDVVHHATLKDVSGNSLPRMILLQHYAPDGIQFDQNEAIYYCSSALSAGTYNFKSTDTDGANSTKYKGKSFQFSITKAIPAGGQIRFNSYTSDYIWGTKKLTDYKLETFANNTTTTALESNINITEGTGGTYLGDLNSNGDSAHANMNSLQRGNGSNNWKQSAIRQWLNSNAPKNTFWRPTNNWDRPPVWLTSADGYLYGIDKEFINALSTVSRTHVTNTRFETPGFTKSSSYTTADKIFLASRTEVYGDKEVSTIADGIGGQFQYYVGSSNIDKIKYDRNGGTAQYWWLGTPNVGIANNVRRVNTDGSLGSTDAIFNSRAVPACII